MMKSLGISSLGLLALCVSVIADPAAQLESVFHQARSNIYARLNAENEVLVKRGIQPACTVDNLAFRQEFGSLPPAARKNYTNAVLCLQKKLGVTPRNLVPGVRSRYDDFVAVHQNQTPFIHFSGTFLGWHRYYVWEYEQSLRKECGYVGSQPYWDWSKWAEAPQDSPIFDGSEYSMGGNGKYIPHDGLVIPPPTPGVNPTIYLEPGLGGGCVQTGPFANMTVNLGPIGLVNSSLVNATVGPDGGLGYNPRCLKRDVGPYCSLKYNNYTRILNLITQRKTIFDFQSDLEGPLGTGDLGPHGGGHFTIAGDPGGDLFTSPGDPAFFLHHAQVDRMWTLWQALDPATRQYALSGTNTMLNQPPSANTTLQDYINLGYAAGSPIQMHDVMSTIGGPFCYVYL